LSSWVTVIPDPVLSAPAVEEQRRRGLIAPGEEQVGEGIVS
jgi:hypothetical protein